jgi:hypothetical protein
MNPFLRIAVDTLSNRDTDPFLTAQRATAYALVAIAEELVKINERADLEAERRELTPKRKACICGKGYAPPSEHYEDCPVWAPF